MVLTLEKHLNRELVEPGDIRRSQRAKAFHLLANDRFRFGMMPLMTGTPSGASAAVSYPTTEKKRGKQSRPVCGPAVEGQSAVQPYALAAARIREFRFLDLRHTAAGYHASQGASLREIADTLDHRKLT